jgi:hypothetical protein
MQISCCDCGEPIAAVTNRKRCNQCREIHIKNYKRDWHIRNHPRVPQKFCVDCGASLPSAHHHRCLEHQQARLREQQRVSRAKRADYYKRKGREWWQQNRDHGLKLLRDRYRAMRRDPRRWADYRAYQSERYALRQLLSDPAAFQRAIQQRLLARLLDHIVGQLGERT